MSKHHTCIDDIAWVRRRSELAQDGTAEPVSRDQMIRPRTGLATIPIDAHSAIYDTNIRHAFGGQSTKFEYTVGWTDLLYCINTE